MKSNVIQKIINSLHRSNAIQKKFSIFSLFLCIVSTHTNHSAKRFSSYHSRTFLMPPVETLRFLYSDIVDGILDLDVIDGIPKSFNPPSPSDRLKAEQKQRL